MFYLICYYFLEQSKPVHTTLITVYVGNQFYF